MNKFFMHEPDGRIHTVCGRESDLLPMPRDGYIFRPWHPMSPPEPPTPTSVAYWLDSAAVWVETASIDELRTAKRQAINDWKLEANNTYFEFADEQIAYRESDRIEIQAVHNWVTLTNTMPTWPDWPGAWKAISNRWVPLPDVDTWKAFTLAIAERGTAHFKHAQVLKQAVAAAATPAEIEAITW